MQVEQLGGRVPEAIKRWVAASIVIVSIALATGCGVIQLKKPAPSAEEKILTSGQWHLVQLNHQPVAVADTSRAAWLRFDGATHRIEASGGCNRMSGTYSVNGAMLHFDKVMSTMMACADPAVNRQEQAFKDALSHVDRFDIYRDRLELSVGADLVLVMSR